MYKIRKIQRKDYKKAAYIKSIAFYAGEQLYSSIEKICAEFEEIEDAKDCDIYVCLKDEDIAGLITVNKFKMNYCGSFIRAYALGGVSVHINFRKMGVADKLVRFFLDHAKKNGADIAMLYPFKPSFYKKYGFGWGTEKYEYTLSTEYFNFYDSKNVISFMPGGLQHLRLIHEQYAEKTHGMCLWGEMEWLNFKKDIDDDSIMIIKDDEGNYIGYAIVRFEKDPQYNMYDQEIIIERLIALTPDAVKWFFSYIYTLKDQFQTVKVITHDNYFYYNLNNAGSIYNAIIQPSYHYTARAGLGIMYKAINAQKLLDMLAVKDTENGYCFIISEKYNNSIIKAYLGNKKKYKEIYINADDFSSWIMGCIPAYNLYALGLITADISTVIKLDRDVKIIKPICTSAF